MRIESVTYQVIFRNKGEGFNNYLYGSPVKEKSDIIRTYNECMNKFKNAQIVKITTSKELVDAIDILAME